MSYKLQVTSPPFENKFSLEKILSKFQSKHFSLKMAAL